MMKFMDFIKNLFKSLSATTNSFAAIEKSEKLMEKVIGLKKDDFVATGKNQFSYISEGIAITIETTGDQLICVMKSDELSGKILYSFQYKGESRELSENIFGNDLITNERIEGNKNLYRIFKSKIIGYGFEPEKEKDKSELKVEEMKGKMAEIFANKLRYEPFIQKELTDIEKTVYKIFQYLHLYDFEQVHKLDTLIFTDTPNLIESYKKLPREMRPIKKNDVIKNFEAIKEKLQNYLRMMEEKKMNDFERSTRIIHKR